MLDALYTAAVRRMLRFLRLSSQSESQPECHVQIMLHTKTPPNEGDERSRKRVRFVEASSATRAETHERCASIGLESYLHQHSNIYLSTRDLYMFFIFYRQTHRFAIERERR